MPDQPRSTGKLLITVACASSDEAKRIAHVLVEKRLAACVQILPAIESVYRWKGHLETAQEALLLVKSRADHWVQLVAAIRALHSYETPEILAMPITHGLPEYLAWMDAENEF